MSMPKESDTTLRLELLEPRFMLSTVAIYADGSMGDESFELLIDDQTVASYTLNDAPEIFTFTSSEEFRAERIKIAFTNDLFDPILELDRNLIIDKIVVDGVEFETESNRTFSTGTWNPDTNLIEPGYLESEWLHTDGFFQFAKRSQVEIIAFGSTGDEIVTLNINGVVADSWQLDTVSQSLVTFVEPSVDVAEDVVQVEFINDLFDPDNGVDRDVFVDKIIVDGTTFETEASTTYSTGTFVGPGLPTSGFFETEALQVGGYFEFLAATDIDLLALGNEGTESIELQIDRQTVVSFDLASTPEVYSYRHITKLRAGQLRIVFDNEFVDSQNGIDTSVTVDWIEINGSRIETESEFVYSEGVWSALDQQIGPGLGRGETLDVNGFFQFAVVPYDLSLSIPENAINVPLNLGHDGLQIQQAPVVTTPPINGTLSLENGILIYSPAADFFGADSFQYQFEDGGPIATVSLQIEQSHQQPQHLLNSNVADSLTPSGKFLEVEKLVQLPRSATGGQPRMNSMALLGDRVFIVTDGSIDGAGNIFELVTGADGSVTVELFLDVGAAVLAQTGLLIDNSSPLNGLRSVAFHPEFATNGKLYVTYTGQRPSDPENFYYLSDPVDPVNVESVLAEFTFDFVNNVVDATSYREVFRVGMRNSEHSIRQAIFNPYSQPGDEDYGLLYVGHGDGSEQSAVSGDGLNNDGLGKILRVNPLANGVEPFSVPQSNPFVDDSEMIDEAYAIGFRNPHNLTFARDSAGNVHLIVTEIGRDNIEEINVVVAGESYGWGDREGPFVHDPISGTINGLTNLPADEATNEYTFPVAIFGHEGEIGTSFVGQAIAGGHVIQNGTSELDDQFIFVEFATDGRAYHVDFSEMLEQNTKLDPNDPANDSPEDLTWITPSELTILFDHDGDDSTVPLIRNSLKDVLDDEPDFRVVRSAGKVRADLRLGQGPNGELYILNKRNGWVYVATNTLPESDQNILLAQDDTATTPVNTAVTVDVTSNDLPENASLKTTTNSTNGTVEVVGQSITYTPNVDFVGDDSFSYQLGLEPSKLFDSSTANRDQFGHAVAVDGDFAVISARLAEDRGQPINSGLVFVYQRDDAGWSQVAKLAAPDPTTIGPGDLFGSSVAIDGNTIVVGSIRHDIDGANDTGAAYIFENVDPLANDWQFVKKLGLESPEAGSQFGFAVDIEGDTIAVSSRLHDAPGRPGTNHGSISIFDRNDGGPGQWGRVTTFFNSGGAGDMFGTALSIEGDLLVAGAPKLGGSNVGAVFVHHRHEGGVNQWGERQRIENPNPFAGDQFGDAVDLSGDTIVVGSPLDDVDDPTTNLFDGRNAGSVHVFERSDASLSFQLVAQFSSDASLDFVDGESNDRFGTAVAIDGDRIVVGAPFTNAEFGAAGIVYQLRKTSGVWSFESTFQPSGISSGDKTPRSLAIDGDVTLLGTPLDDESTLGGIENGSATVISDLVDEALVRISVE
ncbi:MAG: carbohydrate-binding domain-containing protein [Planctomycetota bacterium]